MTQAVRPASSPKYASMISQSTVAMVFRSLLGAWDEAPARDAASRRRP
jgi:hypothetical protein